MKRHNLSSIIARNHVVIFTVTFIALMIVSMLTIYNAVKMDNAISDNRAHAQVIFDKPVPSGLEAATEVVNVSGLKQPSLPLLRQKTASEGLIKPYLLIWLSGLFSVMLASVFFMFRTLKQDQDMLAVSSLHMHARYEH